MLLVALGWLYVVGMYAITQDNFVAGAASFLFAGLVPAGVMVWFALRRMRGLRLARSPAAQAAAPDSVAVADQGTHQRDGADAKRDQ